MPVRLPVLHGRQRHRRRTDYTHDVKWPLWIWKCRKPILIFTILFNRRKRSKEKTKRTKRFKERKYWTEWTEHIQSLVQIKRKAALTFNGNWVSMYDPIKIDPYLLLQKQKRKKRKILHNSVWKSCVFYDYFIPFHTMYTHSLYLVLCVCFLFLLPNRRIFWCCIYNVHIKWTRTKERNPGEYAKTLFFPVNSV